AEDPAVLSMKESLRQAEAGNASGLRRLEEIDRAVPEWEKHWKKFLNERQKVADQANRLTERVDQAVAKAKELKDQYGRFIQAAFRSTEGQEKLVSGRHQLEEGEGDFSERLRRMQSGQRDLAQGLRDGAKKAKEQVEDSGKKGAVMSDPFQF